VVLWRGLAEISQKYLHKGDLVYIEGKLRTRSWEKEGVTRYTTEIVADNMTMLGSRSGGGSSSSSPDYGSRSAERAPSESSYGAPADTTDDLPF
jgi:single-strand DNA-binding protein